MEGINIKYTAVVGVISVVLFFLALKDDNYRKQYDPYEYAKIGENIWAGKGITYNGFPDVVLPPGFPLAIGAVNLVANDTEWSGKSVCMVAFLISLFMISKIASFFSGDKNYIHIAVLLFATNSNILINAASGYSESLFMLVFLILTWLTLRSLENGVTSLSLITFSFLWSWFYLIRPEGLAVGGVLFLWIALNHFRKEIILLVPVVFFILIFPYLFFLKENTGTWQLSGKTYVNLVMGELNSPYQKETLPETIPKRYTVIDQTHLDPSLSTGFSKYWNEPENDIFRRISVNLKKLGVTYWFTFSVLGLALGIWGFILIGKRSAFFLITILSPIFLYVIFFVLPRTVAIYHWIWMLAIANGIRYLGNFLESKVQRVHAVKAAWVIAGMISVYQFRSVIEILIKT